MSVSIDWDRLTAQATHQPDWAALTWSQWHDVASVSPDLAPSDPGLYRLRHPGVDGLIAIDEFDQRSATLGTQLADLATTVYTDREIRTLGQPPTAGDGDPLAAWLIRQCQALESARLDVSYATPPRADRGRWFRQGIVAALVAIHRLATDRWPWPAGRDSLSEPVTDRLPPGVRSWTDWEAPRDTGWLGFDWSDPRRLGALENTEIPENGLYRTWRPSEADGTLRYIGRGSRRDLQRHRLIDGDDARFSLVPFPDEAHAETSVSRSGLQAELIGAHHLAVGHPPFRQFVIDEAHDRLFDQ